LAVQWDSENDKFTTWFSKIKAQIPEVSKEADNLLKKIASGDLKFTSFKSFSDTITISDESLKSFLKTWDGIGDPIQAYNSYLQSAGKQTSAFASGVQKAGSVLKSLGATLASMAIMWGIGKGIELLVTGIDNLVHRAEKANEAMERAFSDYDSAKEQAESTHEQLTSVNSQIDTLKSKGPLTFVEQSQLQTLQETSAELSKQADYYDRIAANKSTEAMQSAVESYNANKTKYDLTTLPTSWGEVDRMNPSQLSGLLDDKTASSVTNDYGNMLYIYRKALFEQYDAVKLGNNDLADEYADVAKEYKQKLSEALSDYQTQLMTIEKVPENLWTEDVIKVHDELQKNINILFPEIDPNGYGDYITNDILSQYDGLKEELIDLADVQNTSGLSVATLKDKYPDLANAITDAGYSVDTFVESINRQATALIEGKSNVELMEEEFSNFQASSIDLINSLDSVNAALVNSVSGKGLSIEIDADTGEITGDIENIKAAYQSLNGYDADILFEKTANGVTLNRKALRLLQAQQESIQKDKFQEKQRELTQKLTQAYKEQAAAIDQGKDGSEQLATINSLNAQLQAVSELSAAYDGATSAYQKWVDAQSGGEEGDMYDAITSTALERGKELYDKGLVGTEEFRAITDLFAYGDQSTASVEELVAAYENAAPIISQFFTEGQEGAMSFADKLVELGYASKDAEGAYLFNPADTSKIAENGDTEVQSLAEQLADLPSEVKTSIGLEAEDDASAIIEKIKQDPGSITIPVKYQNVNNPDAGVDGETKTVTVNEVQGTTVSVEDETKTITVNYSLGSQTEPLDKTASVNYQTGEQEEPLDKPAIVNYDLGMQQSPISPVSATVNYKLGTVAMIILIVKQLSQLLRSHLLHQQIHQVMILIFIIELPTPMIQTITLNLAHILLQELIIIL